MGKLARFGVVFRLGCLALAVAAPGTAQPASLVRDISSEVGDSGFGPNAVFYGLQAAGDRLYFGGTGEGSEAEVWVSDGTTNGTGLLRDVCAGHCSLGPDLLGALGPVLLWDQDTGSAGHQLWRSDGSQSGTYALANVEAVPSLGGVPTAAVFRGVYYFQACFRSGDSVDCDLWRSDGSSAGTRRFQASPRAFGWVRVAGDRLYYSAQTGSSWDLWVTDGTEAGTQCLCGSSGQPDPRTPPVALGNRLYYVAAAGSSGEELWTSDGTAAGTRALTRFAPSSPFSFFSRWLRSAGGRVYFAADDGAHGRELWRSDGTAAGTVRLTNLSAPEPFSDGLPASLAVLGSGVVFAASEQGGSLRLWTSRGSPSSTAPLGLDCPGCLLRFPYPSLIESGGKAYFVLFRDSQQELWVTDGTSAGSRRATRVCAGVSCSFQALRPWKDRLLFVAADGPEERVWSTDGSPAGTSPFVDLRGDRGTFDSFELAELAGTTYFFAKVDHEVGLWVRSADGRGRPVRAVPEWAPIAKGRLLGAAGGRLLFTAQERGGSEEPAFWLSGGTEATTFRLDTDGRSLEVFSHAVAAGDLHYFQARKIGSGEPLQLWRTDGTAAGTFAVVGLRAPAALASWQGGLTFFDAEAIWQTDGTVAGTVKTGDFPSDLRAVWQAVPGPGGLYLLASAGNGASHVWITDGSTAGTRQLTSPTENGSAGRDPQFTPIGSTVYFYWLDGLWKTDGTAAGTVRFHSLPGSEIAVDLAPLQGRLVYLTADFSPATAVRLWRSDGTPEGTVQLAAFPGQDVFADNPVHLVPLAGRLYFGIDDRAHGIEPWATDGTAEGTALALDLVPGAVSSLPREMTVVGGRMYFSAADPRHGREIWVSDGTASGTRLMQDIAPQAGSSSPEQLTLLADKLYFTADDGVTGREPWVLPLGGPSACLPSAARLCLGGGRYAVDAAWRDPAGHRGLGHAAPLTPDTGTFWFFDPANVEVVLKVLDGTGVNGHVWVFYGALSNVEYALTVTDTQTGLAHRYLNPQGELASVGDTQAFGPQGTSLASVTTVAGGGGEAPTLALTSRRVVPRAATGACAPSSTRLCLNGGRFAVEVAWRDFAGNTGAGQARGLTADTGWFWFFDPANVELMLKILDGTPVNGHRWVFYGALSNVEYTVTVTDTQTGEVRTYRNPSGHLASVADTAAF